VVLAGEAEQQIACEQAAQLVDTTGAGDQYAAGFLSGLAAGRTLADCGRLGSIAAAEVVSHFGPRPQVRLKDLVAARGL
jgi:sugar/nucleoside kinase (ribokinase family)